MGYRNPGNTRMTNARCNNLIREYISRSKAIDIYALAPSSPLNYGAYKINLAAGLEDALINFLEPEWNGSTLGRVETETALREEQELSNSSEDNGKILEQALHAFSFTLQKSYLEHGFFNINSTFSKLLGADGEGLLVKLDDGPIKSIKIDRKSNTNGSVRIHFGKELKKWLVKQGSQVGDTIFVDLNELKEFLLRTRTHQ